MADRILRALQFIAGKLVILLINPAVNGATRASEGHFPILNLCCDS